MTQYNYLPAIPEGAPQGPQGRPAAPSADLMRKQDVIGLVNGVVDIYTQQQRAALSAVQAETVQGRGFLSDAAQVAERRKTSRMYLVTYSGVSALIVGGLAWIAYLASGVGGSLALAGWVFGTGALTLILVWTRHGSEFAHSPEGIARHVIDWHGWIAQYEAETKRYALQWEHTAQARREDRAELSAERARAGALEAERKRAALAAQNDRDRADFWAAWEARAAERAAPSAAPAGGSMPPELPPVRLPAAPAGGPDWREGLIEWVCGLYTDPAALSENGVVKVRAPWSARSPWPEDDKQEMKRAAMTRRPALFEDVGGGRLRLRVELFDTVDAAAGFLAARTGGTE